MKHLELFEGWKLKSLFKKPAKIPPMRYWDIEKQVEVFDPPINKYKLVKVPDDEKFLISINDNDESVAFQYAFTELGFRDYYDEKDERWLNIRRDEKLYYHVENTSKMKKFEAWSSDIPHGKLDNGTAYGITGDDTSKYTIYEFGELFEPLEKYKGQHIGKNYGV